MVVQSRIDGGENVYSMTTEEYMTVSKDQTSTLMARDYKDPQCVAYQCSWDGGQTRGPSAVCSKEKSERERYIVRRLTPLECERLQGFPDFWTDIGEWTDSKGKLHKESSDSARYAALGNSIALPSWFYVLSKLSEFCEEKTMASLFDGISGFNVCWARINGAENCLWSSEIEEFPIAVTKHHFPDEEAEAGGNGG